MKRTITAVCAALLLTTGMAQAAPTVTGSTGMLYTPTADVLRDGHFSLGYHHLEDGDAYTVGYGMSNAWEISAATIDYNGDHGRDLYLNTKFSLMSENVVRPGIAIGMEDALDEYDRTFYAVASKALPLGLRIHAGIGDGRFDGVFGGIEKTFNPLGVTGSSIFPATTLSAEYDGKEMIYGLRLAIVPGLKAHAAWRDGDTYVGLTFTY
ncbi:MAG: YjbH domain-containing protein [Selenomonadales bacterium]|nr:YjbH domain-containing protein [Selenomonadales bacterium]MBQ2246640.1 YjbH domain-containing protein [Selenomonadales bacterium]MBQ5832369.1 YjbH domain-containing protein [Selenomonadales bacterium]MBR0325687.1 YjbH domain-containing protein [Selenomonadales bacterium]